MQLLKSEHVLAKILAEPAMASTVRAYANQFYVIESLEILSRILAPQGRFRAADGRTHSLRDCVLVERKVLLKGGAEMRNGRQAMPILARGFDTLAKAFQVYRPKAIMNLTEGWARHRLISAEFKTGIPIELQVGKALSGPEPTNKVNYSKSLHTMLTQVRMSQTIFVFPTYAPVSGRWDALGAQNRSLLTDLRSAKAIVVGTRMVEPVVRDSGYSELPEDTSTHTDLPSPKSSEVNIEEFKGVILHTVAEVLLNINYTCTFWNALTMYLVRLAQRGNGKRAKLPRKEHWNPVTETWVRGGGDDIVVPPIGPYWYDQQQGAGPQLATPVCTGFDERGLITRRLGDVGWQRKQANLVPKNSSSQPIGTMHDWLEWYSLNFKLEAKAKEDPYYFWASVIEPVPGVDNKELLYSRGHTGEPWERLLYRVRGLDAPESIELGMSLVRGTETTTENLKQANSMLQEWVKIN
jgi:hypothetical protein